MAHAHSGAKPRRLPEQKRVAILEAATQLFAQRGYAKTSVSEIAAAAEISKGLVYVHFPSKEALLEAVMTREISSWIVDTTSAAREGRGSVTETLSRALRRSIEYARRNPFLRLLLAQDPGLLLPARIDSDEVEPLQRAYRDLLEPLLRHGVETGELAPDYDPSDLGRVIWLMHESLIRTLFVDASAADACAESSLVDSMIRMIEAGIRNR